jgi:Pyruvate/2-oxoacid:ferredoxin oxidoreductase delta subunit
MVYEFFFIVELQNIKTRIAIVIVNESLCILCNLLCGKFCFSPNVRIFGHLNGFKQFQILLDHDWLVRQLYLIL